ncbi:MAG: TonB family protein [Ignavibacteriales bacterium]|nr:TonB family protein [Ignavibacteriales bacterium]
MKNIVFLFCSIITISCSSIPQNETNSTRLELLEKYPLPTVLQEIYKPNFRISALMLINQNGSVIEVKLLRSSGDHSWDMKLIESLKKWKYAPPLVNNHPRSIWIQQNIRIEIGEPLYLSFSEILCENIVQANEVYEALKKGQDFGDLALKYSINPSRINRGKVESVDIHIYPDYLQKELKSLNTHEFSMPIRYGDKFLIVKRNGT